MRVKALSVRTSSPIEKNPTETVEEKADNWQFSTYVE